MSSPGRPSVPLYRAAQVRELDRRAIEDHGIPGYTLMTRAAQVSLDLLQARYPEARQLTILCGAGNNAGDGYVLARLAVGIGLNARVVALHDPRKLRGDAATAARDAAALGIAIRPWEEAPPLAGVVVDALLGTGLSRAVDGAYGQAIEAINHSGLPVLAVDIPSGLQADTGAVLGVAVRANCCATFIGPKVGLYTGRGPALCGQLRFDDLGVPAAVYQGIEAQAQLYGGEDLDALLAPRARDAHKGHHGHVLVVGGDLGTGGAARMAAEAAARVGAGLVSVATREAHLAAIVGPRPELMVHGVQAPEQLDELLDRASVVAVGPGLGQGAWGRGLFHQVLDSGLPLVVDADGLNLLAMEPRQRDDWVLTPHPGEAARLLESRVVDIQADRFAAAGSLRQRYGGTCLLKGAGTLVVDSDGSWVIGAGNPGMASGGMGDVLTGVVAGLMAQGLSGPAAARAGAWVHGRAADLAAVQGERGLLAGDLLGPLRRLVNPGLDHSHG